MNKIAKANIILLVQYALGSLIPLLLIPHIVSVIGLVEYGRIAVVMAWGGYGAMVVQYAFQMTGPARVMQAKTIKHKKEIFLDITKAKLILMLIVFSLNIIGVIFFVGDNLLWLLLFFFPFASFLNSVWYLQTQDKHLHVCLISIVSSICTLILGFNYIEHGGEHLMIYVVLATILTPVLTGLGTLIMAKSIIVPGSFLSSDFRGAIKEIHNGWSLFASQFISMLYTSLGPIVIGLLLGVAEVGAYSVMERIINAFIAAAMLTHVAAYPSMAAAYKENKKIYLNTVKNVISVYIIFILLLGLLGWIMRDEVVIYLYGEINEHDHNMLLLSGFIWSLLAIFGTVLTGYLTISGRASQVVAITKRLLVVSLVFGCGGILIVGESGWLFGLSVAQLIVLYFCYYFWKKEQNDAA